MLEDAWRGGERVVQRLELDREQRPRRRQRDQPDPRFDDDAECAFGADHDPA